MSACEALKYNGKWGSAGINSSASRSTAWRYYGKGDGPLGHGIPKRLWRGNGRKEAFRRLYWRYHNGGFGRNRWQHLLPSSKRCFRE